MKIRSSFECEDFIDNELAWRKKELTNIRNLALAKTGHSQILLFRAAIPIFYAHWEAIVKKISIALLQYLVSKGYKYKDLKPSFSVFAVLEKHKGQISFSKFEPLADIFTNEIFVAGEAIHINPETYIDTGSNLNSIALKDIVKKIGINYSHFELKANFIDETFLKKRHAICHGENIVITQIDFHIIYDEVFLLINLFENLARNWIATNEFLVASSSPTPPP